MFIHLQEQQSSSRGLHAVMSDEACGKVPFGSVCGDTGLEAVTGQQLKEASLLCTSAFFACLHWVKGCYCAKPVFVLDSFSFLNLHPARRVPEAIRARPRPGCCIKKGTMWTRAMFFAALRSFYFVKTVDDPICDTPSSSPIWLMARLQNWLFFFFSDAN